MLTNLHANPCGRSVSQRILGAHYTQISGHPLQARGAILIAEHSRPRGLFDQSRRSRPGGGVPRRLVEARAVGKSAGSGAKRTGPGTACAHRHAELCRCRGAGGAGRGQCVYRASGHGAHSKPHPQSIVRRFLAELSAAGRAQLGLGRHRRCRGNHRDEPARHRRRGFDPGAIGRRPHRRRDRRRTGSRYGSRHFASGHRQGMGGLRAYFAGLAAPGAGL